MALLREMFTDIETEEIPVSEIVRVKKGKIIGEDIVGGGSAWYMWISLEPTEDGYMVIYTKGDSHGEETDGTPLYQTTVGVVLLVSDTGGVQWMHTFDGNAADYSNTCGDPIVHDDGTFSVLVRNEPAIFEERFTLARHRFTLAGEPVEGLLPIDEAHLAYRDLMPLRAVTQA